MTLQEIMGQETYNLLYAHYDQDGVLIDDMEDVLYCDDEGISQDRVTKLETLLSPITDLKSSLISLEAAKLLAAWGSDKAIDYFELCVDQRIDCLGNLEPHRLHGYDTIYEKIASSSLHYYARCFDRSLLKGEDSRKRLFPLLSKIISLSKNITLDIAFLIEELEEEGWKEYLPLLKEYYLELARRPNDDLNKKWNIDTLSNVLQLWEPEFLNNLDF